MGIAMLGRLVGEWGIHGKDEAAMEEFRLELVH
jgi:hypothetical protein